MTESEKVIARRKATLDVTFEAARSKHEKRSKELASQSHKAELILIAWGFIFAGIAGFYQAGVLNTGNTQQVIYLLIPILASIGTCVVQVISRQKEIDVPNLSELWKSYVNSYAEDFANYDDISAKEQLIQSYIDAEGSNRKRLGKKAYWLTLASWAIVIEILLIVTFVLLPELAILVTITS